MKMRHSRTFFSAAQCESFFKGILHEIVNFGALHKTPLEFAMRGILSKVFETCLSSE